MIRTKIDYGIDLGTTNSAISRMENGEPKIIKSDAQKDIMPSCVMITNKKIFIGDKAFAQIEKDKKKAFNDSNFRSNIFIEFKRTMGTDAKYVTDFGKEFTSEELSAEVLKKLKSFVLDEDVNSAIITIPAAFKMNQIDATRRAAEMAGFQYVELLQEPIAAAMAYGINSKDKNGFWLVFDFGGGTFDSALIKVEDGIMKVIDTEGDNYLGGKNLDYAIVDKIIIPYLKENYKIESILNNEQKYRAFQEMWKPVAEDAKNQLSFKEEHEILTDLYDDYGFDDNGNEFELDISLTRDQLKQVIAPYIQKAVDLTRKLLQRNNLKGDALTELILVGGPTLSPILREMVAEQIKKPNTSVDPMTVVSKGAALYASTIDIPEDLKEQTRDKSKIQLEISHEATTVELEEYVTIKLLPDKTEGKIPEKVFIEIKRNDGAWSSGRVEINEIGEVVDVQLNEGRNNVFTIVLFDDKGNILECEPESFSIIQGSKIGSATLPYNIGVEVKDKTMGKIVFKTVKGLEKNKSLPATGVLNGLKTQKQIRPGMESDFIKIPIYQGEHSADGTRAIYNEHVYDVIISGADLPALLPENSDVDLTIKVDKSQNMTVQAYFPYLDHTAEIEVPRDNVQSVETNWLANEIRKANVSIENLRQSDSIEKSRVEKITQELEEIRQKFERNKDDVDNKMETLSNLRKLLKEVDKLIDEKEWPELEKQLKEAFYNLEEINAEKGNEQTTRLINKLKIDVEKVIQEQDRKIASQLIEEINSFAFEMERLEHLIGFILSLDEDFENIEWADKTEARNMINKGKGIIFLETPSIERLQPIVTELYYNAGFDKKRTSDDNIDDTLLLG
jgi:molecular chaperone DnaK